MTTESISSLVKKLKVKNEDRYTVLKSLNVKIEESEDPNVFIDCIIDEASNFTPILDLISNIDANQASIVILFKYLGHILSIIANSNDSKKSQALGMSITRQVLSYQKKLLVESLNSKNSSLVAAAMYLITGMVNVHSDAAIDVLDSLDFNSVDLKKIASKNVNEIRSHYLQLLLAFLATNNKLCLNMFLGIEGFITSMFNGLNNDPPELVTKFLTSLHQVIVLDMTISKSVKVSLFNKNSCGGLMKLYRSGTIFQLTEEDRVKNLKKESVKKALHQLMLTLCTDYRHGVIFKEKVELSQEMSNRNWQVCSILKSGENLWDFPEGRELIIRTLKACPSATKPYLNNFRDLNPSPTDNYFILIQLLVTIIESTEPWRCFERYDEGSFKFSLLIPRVSNDVLKSLISSSINVLIHSGLILLKAMYLKGEQSLLIIDQMDKLDDEKKNSYKAIVKKSIFSLVGGQKNIFQCYLNFMNSNDTLDSVSNLVYAADNPTKFSILSEMMEIFLLYIKLDGKVEGYSSLQFNINPIDALKVMLNFEEEVINKDPDTYFKCLKSLLSILLVGLDAQNPNLEALSYVEEEFENYATLNKSMLLTLIYVYCHAHFSHDFKEANCYNDVRDLCLSLLMSCIKFQKLTSYSDPHLHLWLNKISFHDAKVCGKFVFSVIQNCIANDVEYVGILDEMKSEREIDILNEVNRSIGDIKDSSVIQGCFQLLPFSSLVISATELLKSDDCDVKREYFSSVMESYIHLANDPQLLVKYLSSNSLLDEERSIYCQAILGCKEKSEKAPLDENSDFYSHLEWVFLCKDWSRSQTVSDYWSNDQNYKLDENDRILICHQLFVYISVDKKLKVSKKKIKLYMKIFKKVISADDNERKWTGLYQTLLKHKFMIDHYNPFLNKDYMHNEIESALMLLIDKYHEDAELIRPFINKLLRNINSLCSMDINLDKIDMKSCILPFVPKNSERILSIQDVTSLMSCCMELPFTDTVEELLCEVSEIISDYSFKSSDSSFCNLIVSKIIKINQIIDQTSRNRTTVKLLEKNLINFMDFSFVETLSADTIKELVNGQCFLYELCNNLVKHDPRLANTISKRLKKCSPVDLETHGPYLLAHFNLDRQNKYLISCLSKAKEDLMKWVYHENSQDNLVNNQLLSVMIETSVLDSSEITDISKFWYESSINDKKKVPSHILSLRPAFNMSPTEEDSVQLKLQSLCITLCVLTKKYGKSEDNKYVDNLIVQSQSLLPQVDSALVQSYVGGHKLWSSFVKHVLKHLMSDLVCGPRMLDYLDQLIRCIYFGKQNISLSLSMIHKMLRSHSKFFNVMTSQDAEFTLMKEKLVTLFQTIVEISSEGCDEHQVYILLCAYGASKSACDQKILKLLHWYESNGFMASCLPIVWDIAAISHFAVADGLETKNSHFSAPVHAQIISRLKVDKVNQTALKFDVHLSLEPIEVKGNDPMVYDERFLMMLFIYLLETDDDQNFQVDDMNLASMVIPFGLAALSSYNDSMWNAGAYLLKMMVEKLQNSKHIHMKLQWIWLVTVVGYGFKGKKSRIPSIIIHFLISASKLFSTPGSKMFKFAYNALFTRSFVSMDKVPEIMALYFTNSVEMHFEHRFFLLRFLKSGIKDNLDFEICEKSFVPKFVLNMLTSPTSNSKLKIQCLHVINSLIAIPIGFVAMIDKHSLLVQLSLALNTNETDLCESMLDILRNIWDLAKNLISIKQNSNKKKRSADNIDEDGEERCCKKQRIELNKWTKSSKSSSFKKLLICEFDACIASVENKLKLGLDEESLIILASFLQDVKRANNLK